MRDIGVDVKTPEGEWDGDENCPFNGSLRVRGQIIEGKVYSSNMSGSIVVEREMTRYMKKYERYEKRTRRYPAHLTSYNLFRSSRDSRPAFCCLSTNWSLNVGTLNITTLIC